MRPTSPQERIETEFGSAIDRLSSEQEIARDIHDAYEATPNARGASAQRESRAVGPTVVSLANRRPEAAPSAERGGAPKEASYLGNRIEAMRRHLAEVA